MQLELRKVFYLTSNDIRSLFWLYRSSMLKTVHIFPKLWMLQVFRVLWRPQKPSRSIGRPQKHRKNVFDDLSTTSESRDTRFYTLFTNFVKICKNFTTCISQLLVGLERSGRRQTIGYWGHWGHLTWFQSEFFTLAKIFFALTSKPQNGIFQEIKILKLSYFND